MTRKTPVLAVLAIAVLLGLYWISSYFAAYTDDAYVDTDLIMLAADVSGTLVSVPVADNQEVAQGELLAEIDPEPYRLALRSAKAALEAAQSKLRLLEKELQRVQADAMQADSELHLATVTEARYRQLLQKKDVPQQEYDEKLATFKIAMDRQQTAAALVAEAGQSLETQQKTIEAARAAAEKARYDLRKTRLLAPEDGYVTGLRLRPGDYAQQGQQLLALIARTGWRIKANYREQFIRHIKPGQEVLLYLDGHPWRLFHGRVQSIAHGISRQAEQGKVLPYVEPTTNWIRLSRRFPVRITFIDLPEDVTLRLGADVRTLVIY